jgi:hypothetical protein
MPQDVKDKSWFEKQQEEARKNIESWPQWMKDTAYVATASAPPSYWAQWYGKGEADDKAFD